MNELTEVPLSNKEVYDILCIQTDKHERTKEVYDYLKATLEIEYSYETLRTLKYSKKLEADLTVLASVANTSDLSILSESDRKKIIDHFK